MGVALPWWGAAIARDRRSRKLRHTLCSRQARRMLQAIADGENNPEALAGLADRRLRGHPGATMRCARRVPELLFASARVVDAGARPAIVLDSQRYWFRR